MQRLTKLFLAIIICEGIGILGSVFTISEISTWYAFLNKPFFSPPNWIFGPVWTTLYFLMGISAFLIYEKKTKAKNMLLNLFGVQLLLNYFWSLIFFGLHLPSVAFIEIILLWSLIFVLIYKFWNVSKVASLLLVPYILWVSFASVLNLFIAILN